jgi:predicted nucleic acid-binding protein
MSDGIIDCCSLLNLYTGWGNLEELRVLPYSWSICESVARESEFTREYGPDGIPIEVALDLRALFDSGLLRVARPENDAEMADYVSFATEIDDGETQALAIAKNRRYALLTDDRKATRIANRPDVGVPTITTATVLREWQERSGARKTDVRKIVERIQELARFIPRRGSPEQAWWVEQLLDHTKTE